MAWSRTLPSLTKRMVGIDRTPKRAASAGMLVHVDLGQGHLAAGRPREVFQDGRDGAAGPAPLGPEIHHQDPLGGRQGLVEGLVVEMKHASSHVDVRSSTC